MRPVDFLISCLTDRPQLEHRRALSHKSVQRHDHPNVPTLSPTAVSEIATVCTVAKAWPGVISYSQDSALRLMLGCKSGMLCRALKEAFWGAMMSKMSTDISQTPEQVAEVMKQAVDDAKPHFRCQTSDYVREAAERKFKDATGDSYVQNMLKILE